MNYYLILNDTEIPLTRGSYAENREYVDNRNVTEAGSTVREIIRTGIVSLSVTLTCDSVTKQMLDYYADQSTLNVSYWSEKSGSLQVITGFLDGYRADLKIDTSERFYEVSFNVKEL